jgi:DNA repair protein RecN (Recombination protein N)
VFELGGREIIVRREVTTQGRSRSFVDGQLVTAGSLKELGVQLVDLHGQHEHQALLNPDVHLDLLDQHAGLAPERAVVAAAYEQWAALRLEQESVGATERDKDARADFLRFQLQEIERVAPRAEEDDELAATRRLLVNAEKLRRLCGESYGRLYEEDTSVLSSLSGIWKRLSELRDLDARFGTFLDARDGITAQLDELASYLREYGAHIDAAPERLQETEDRLAALERLKRKYGPSLADVLARRTQCADELGSLDSAAERLGELERQVAAAGERYRSAAAVLSAKRRLHGSKFARALERELGELAMERTQFEVRFEAGDPVEDCWSARGTDAAQFYVSPNPGEDMRPLARIVSGGELSRMMLALKTLATTDSPGKTLVFDEVDAGIGGRVADVVGQRLQTLGRTFQVLCITHLPQIATCGHSHFRVSKFERNGRTQTAVESLAGEARVDELARMMAGLVVTEGTRASAREMLWARLGESESASKGERRKRK